MLDVSSINGRRGGESKSCAELVVEFQSDGAQFVL